uniref:Uncharacterized protein n=1 Tax=Plectus sambesii TaxID=2011161 RepID=A0A914XBF1_9BILA
MGRRARRAPRSSPLVRLWTLDESMSASRRVTGPAGACDEDCRGSCRTAPHRAAHAPPSSRRLTLRSKFGRKYFSTLWRSFTRYVALSWSSGAHSRDVWRFRRRVIDEMNRRRRRLLIGRLLSQPGRATY